jgi:RND family efflux transporter MFP subunit
MNRPHAGLAWSLLAALAAAGCAGGRAQEAPQPTPVHAARAVREAIAETIVLSGRAAPPADRDASLSAQVAGTVSSVEVREGAEVRRGSIVARIDRAPFADALSAAEAAERSAVAEMEYRRHEADRTRVLVDKGVASGKDAEADAAAAVAAESARAQAGAVTAEARRRLAWASVSAPFDGVVLRVFRSAGDAVDGTPATPILELASPHPIEIAADATAPALARIAAGNRATVLLHGGAQAPLPARVLRAARGVSPASGVGEVRLSLDRPDAALLLGSAVEVRISVAVRPAAVVVPRSAVRHRGDGTAEVVVVSSGKAHPRPVATGIIDGDRVEIASGLEGNEQVVVEDPAGLIEGADVSVQP